MISDSRTDCQVADNGNQPVENTCSTASLVYPGSMETRKCAVLIVDGPCGLELFRVNTEEPTADSPLLELWECPMGHRTHYLSEKEESKLSAEN